MLHLKRSTELLVQKLSDKEFLPLCWVKMQTVNIQTVVSSTAFKYKQVCPDSYQEQGR